MRHLPILAAVLLASPAHADRIKTTAPVTAATLYPWGAGVTREARADLPAGAHELVIPGLPESLDPASLRITAEGAVIGAVGFQTQGALPEPPVKSPEMQAAQAEVRRLTSELARHDAAVAEIAARAAAANDTIEFLMNLAESDAAGKTDITALAGAVGQQFLQARQTAVRARAEADAANMARDDLVPALERAKARLAALSPAKAAHGALVIAVQGQGRPARIRITSLTHQASWAPVYDLALTRKEGKLRLDRGLLLGQNTGEDWQGVHLTLSTARPMDQSAPSELFPEFLRIVTPGARRTDRQAAEALAGMANLAAPAPMADAGSVVAGAALAGLLGETVVYDYPTPVDLRDGADALRLPLDSQDLRAEITAEAVPRRDDRAYLVADAVNSTGAVILPGDASFYADGALVGRGALDLTAAGDDMTLGFGPLDGITLTRRIPDEIEGARGLIQKSAERKETAILGIRNLTAETWPLRVIDQIPVSTQKDLRIDWSANPAPDKIDPKGKRGLLVWLGTLAPGEAREISLTTTIRWPEGQDLVGED